MLLDNAKIFAEANDGMYIGVCDPVVRLEQGFDASSPISRPCDLLRGPYQVSIQMTRFGQPYSNQESGLGLQAYSSRYHGNDTTSTPGPPDVHVNIPTQTNDLGRVVIDLAPKDDPMTLGAMRQEVDGRMNFIVSSVRGLKVGDNNNPISILVWRKFDLPADVNWDNDIGPILGEYAKLYPGMRAKLNIGNQQLVTGSFRASMISHMSPNPLTMAQFMPITRDLAPSRQGMIIDWLTQQGGDNNDNS